MSIDRRDFVKALSASLSAPLAWDAARADAPETLAKVQRKRNHAPNVIVMICDDLGYGDLGSYGSKLPTPNLDRMVAEGARFTHFNSGHPICSASRSALLTGRYAQRTGTEGAFMPHSPTGTSLEEETLGNLFKNAGYKTKCIGKWHLGDAPQYLPTNRGFDSYLGVPYSVDMEPLPLIRDLKAEEAEADRLTLTPRYAGEAVSFLEEAGQKPFFLYLAFSYPHDPPRASAKFAGKTGFGEQGDSIAEIDWAVGEVLQALQRNGQENDTLVFFTSDHGPWFQGSAGALRGRKASTFEGGFRVPMIARWPGQIAGGRVVEGWGSNLDMVPTLAKVCGLTLPKKPLDGADMGELLFAKTPHEVQRKPILYFTPMSNKGWDVHCIRVGDWKLRVAQGMGNIYINDAGGGNMSEWLPKPELYDLRRDPQESYDVANGHPERVKEMLAALDEAMQTFPPKIVESYTALKERVASKTTPPGAAARKSDAHPPDWIWIPEDRR